MCRLVSTPKIPILKRSSIIFNGFGSLKTTAPASLTSLRGVAIISVNVKTENNKQRATDYALNLATTLNSIKEPVLATFSTEKTLMLKFPLHFYLQISVGGFTNGNFALRSLGKSAFELARDCAAELWNGGLYYSRLSNTTCQRFYELTKQGVICVGITYPGTEAFRLEYQKANQALVKAIAKHIHRRTFTQ